jgi:hypothetical protein
VGEREVDAGGGEDAHDGGVSAGRLHAVGVGAAEGGRGVVKREEMGVGLKGRKRVSAGLEQQSRKSKAKVS